MASGTLAPAFWYQALDDTGVAVAGALVNFYVSGSSTRLTAYSDAALTVPLANPAACDAAGRLVIYFSPTAYKIVVTTSAGVPIGLTVDPVTSTGSSGSGLVGAAIGEVFVFGSNPASPITVTSYPAGATFDKLQPGSSVLSLDSANLASGTYVLDVTGLQDTAGTLTVALVNLDSGSPDTPIATATITSLTGQRSVSTAITFAPGGTANNYGIKTKVSANSGFLIGARLTRTG
jgi:hypothetical protein